MYNKKKFGLAGRLGLLTGEPERSLLITAVSKEARLLTCQLRAPGGDVL